MIDLKLYFSLLKRVSALLMVILSTVALHAQIPKTVSKKMGMYPLIFLDSTETTMGELYALDPFDISGVTIVTPKKAKKILGEKAADGAVYVTTLKAAKIWNWDFLRSKSGMYKQLIPSPDADTLVQYVVNNTLIPDSAAIRKLFSINDRNFKSIKFMERETEKSDYATSKPYIVVIKAKNPDKGLIKTPKPKK